MGIVPVPPVALPPPPPPSLAKKGPPGKKMQFRSAKWDKTADFKYKKVSDEYSLPAPPKALPPPPGPSLAKKGPRGKKLQQRSSKWTQISAKKWQKVTPEYSLLPPPELPPPGWKPPPKNLEKLVVKRQESQKIREAKQMMSSAPVVQTPPTSNSEVGTSKVITPSGGKFRSLFGKLKGSKKKTENLDTGLSSRSSEMASCTGGTTSSSKKGSGAFSKFKPKKAQNQPVQQGALLSSGSVSGNAGTVEAGVGATTKSSIFSKFKLPKAKVKGEADGGTGVGTGRKSCAGNIISSENSKQVERTPHSLSSGDSGFNDEFSAL